MGTPRYFKVYFRSIFCSVAVLAATNSEPNGALLKTRMKPSSSSNSAPAMMNVFHVCRLPSRHFLYQVSKGQGC